MFKMHLTTVLFFLQCLSACSMHLEQLPIHETGLRLSLTQCVISASERFFKRGETVVFALSVSKDELYQASVTPLNSYLIPALMQKTRWPIIVKCTSKKSHAPNQVISPSKNYIIQVRTNEEFLENIKALRTTPSWNPHANFMIITAVQSKNVTEFAARIMEGLWNQKVVNGVVMVPRSSDNMIFDVYSWFPFKGGACGDDFKRIELIDSCSSGTIEKNVSWFRNKIPGKFNKCLVRVRKVDWPPYVINVANGSSGVAKDYFVNRGIEVNMLDMIAERFNLEMIYISSDTDLNWGDVYPNGTVTGNLLYLHRDEDDIAIGCYGTTVGRSLALDSSTVYFQERLHWCAQHNPIGKNLGYLTSTISSGAWVVIVLVYFISSFLMWLSSSNNELNAFKNLPDCFKNSYLILLGLPIPSQPRTGKVRFVIAMLLVCSFSIISAYQTLMISVLADEGYDETISKFEDIFEQNFDIYGLPGSKRYFTPSRRSEVMNFIHEKWKICLNIKQCISKVVVEGTSVVVLPHLYFQYILRRYMTSGGEPLLHCLKEPIVSYPVSILMSKGFPLYSKIDHIFSQLLSAGFVLKWEREIAQKRYRNVTTVEVNEDFKKSDLVFSDLKPVFLILLLGCTLSLLAFLGELLCFRSMHKHKGESDSTVQKKSV